MKGIFIKNLAFATCLSLPLLLCSCQGVDELFSDSSSADEHSPSSHHNQRATVSTYSSTSATTATSATAASADLKENVKAAPSSSQDVADQATTRKTTTPTATSTGPAVPSMAPTVGQ